MSNNKLPSDVEQEAKQCLSILVNHIDIHNKLPPHLETLTYSQGKHSQFLGEKNHITFARKHFHKTYVHYEESSHLIRYYLKPPMTKEEINPFADEFFGFLGRLVGLKLQMNNGEKFFIPDSRGHLIDTLNKIDILTKEEEKLSKSLKNFLKSKSDNAYEQIPTYLEWKPIAVELQRLNRDIITHATGYLAAEGFMKKNNTPINNFSELAIDLYHQKDTE